MTVLLVASAIVALVLPGLHPPFVLRGRPSTLAVLHALALLLGLVSMFAAGILGAGVFLAALFAPEPLGRAAGHLAPGGLGAGAAACVALAALSWRAVGVSCRLRRLRKAVSQQCGTEHVERHGDDVVVLASAVPFAFAVTGSRSRVVLSRGLLDQLEGPLVGFVVAHERSHLRQGHHRLLAVAAVAEGVLGVFAPVGRSAGMVRLAVELAADDEAAGTDGERRGYGADALRRLAHTPGLHADPVVSGYRARRLLQPAVHARSVPVIAAVGLVVVAMFVAAAAGHAGSDLPEFVARLG